MAYAEQTKISTERTKAEIESLVMRNGADNFAAFSSRTEAKIAFEHSGRRILFTLPLPSQDDDKYHWTNARRRRRTKEASFAAWEKDCRSKWRALLLAIKAKFESVEAGIESFEETFLAHIMTPDGQRFGEIAIPQIASAYQTQTALPPLLGKD